MEMWQVQISTHFLALHIWKFPPWKNSFIFDGKILMWEIDGFVNAANVLHSEILYLKFIQPVWAGLAWA